MSLWDNIVLCRECLDLVQDGLLDYIASNKLSKYSLEDLERLYDSFEVTDIEVIVSFVAESRYDEPFEVIIPIRDLKK
jgi:hypothetical protein